MSSSTNGQVQQSLTLAKGHPYNLQVICESWLSKVYVTVMVFVCGLLLLMQ